MMSSRHGPYELGHFMCYNGYYNPITNPRGCVLIQKDILSSDRRLQFVFVKVESLVIVDQQRYGEYVPKPCTHRPSRLLSLFCITFLERKAVDAGKEKL